MNNNVMHTSNASHYRMLLVRQGCSRGMYKHHGKFLTDVVQTSRMSHPCHNAASTLTQQEMSHKQQKKKMRRKRICSEGCVQHTASNCGTERVLCAMHRTAPQPNCFRNRVFAQTEKSVANNTRRRRVQ